MGIHIQFIRNLWGFKSSPDSSAWINIYQGFVYIDNWINMGWINSLIVSAASIGILQIGTPWKDVKTAYQ